MRLALFLCFVAPAATAMAAGFSPTFASEALAPEADVVLPLLKVVCADGVRTVNAKGGKSFGCGDGSMEEILASRHRPRSYGWMPYVLWQADGLLFGHFLSPTSEDVAINCYACENHPDLWGGTLLLTKRSGEWQPVWYRAGIITRHCRRVTLATGRQILFCEEPDGGMGHRFHLLYLVDFTKPKSAWDSVVLMADTYSSVNFLGVQTQFIDRVSFEEDPQGGLLVRVNARHGRIRLRPDDQREVLPKPKVLPCEIDLRLDGTSFRATPQTAATARLFGLK